MIASDSRGALMQSGLNLIGQALSIFDADLRLAVANRQYQALFDLPDNLTRPGAFFEDTAKFQTFMIFPNHSTAAQACGVGRRADGAFVDRIT